MSFKFLYEPILNDYHYGAVALILICAFAALYFVLATTFYIAVNYLFKRQILKRIIDKPYFSHQFRFEILHSIWSFIIFGLYGTLIVFLYRIESLVIGFEGGYLVVIDLSILAIWNEIHFYSGHRLMHSKFLVKFHRVHHKSVVVTPYSTYSFHPLESVIMGSVMIIPLLFYPFQIWSLIIFPIYHLFFNTVGHTNAQFKNDKKRTSSISSRHNSHHTKFSINYGFVSTFTDRFANLFNQK
ncbi:MAG: sterol desaturase family protein [Crocinitomicaceae bacterium]